MHSIQLNLVYQYRRLISASGAGRPLSDSDHRRLRTIESLFAATVPGSADAETPSFRRLDQMSAVLRVSRVSEPVRVAALDFEQAICFCSAEVEVAESAEVELIFDDDGGSYRFKAQVAWSRSEVDAKQILGLELRGVPLLLRRGPPSDKTHSIIERMLGKHSPS